MLITDQMGRTISITHPIQRIVSLVPSQTELLVAMGLRDKLVGITKFCVHPNDLTKEIQVIGGTKTVKIEEVIALKPDIVIGNKEENLQTDIEVLEKHVPVWMSDISNLEEAQAMILLLGEITSKQVESNEIVQQINTGFEQLGKVKIPEKPPSVLYLIWRKPYMAAGKETFIDDMLSRCGLENCLSDSRYPTVDFNRLNPELILLSSEPYPFAEKHIAELKVQFPNAKIMLVDGEYFSWYGSRLIDAPAYFQTLDFGHVAKSDFRQ